MLKNFFTTPTSGMSDAAYGKLIKFQTNVITVIFCAIGTILFILSFPIYRFISPDTGDFFSGLYSGLFAGAFAYKILNVIHLSNPTVLHEKKVKAVDERLQNINQRTDALLFKMIRVIAYLLLVVGGVFYHQNFIYLAIPFFLILIARSFLRWLLNKLL